MVVVNIHQAKTNLSKLINEVLSGQEMWIARAGKPVAKLVPITTEKPKRKPGRLKGRLRVAVDFDAPLPNELLARFYG